MNVYIGLGSNVGDRLGSLRRAVDALRDRAQISVVAVSSVYETAPIGPAQPDFLNAVVEIDTELAPGELLRVCRAIEDDIGRVTRERWGPREIDLDVLVYGDRAVSGDDLEIPHVQIAARAFVLVPLEEIAPALEIPGVGSVAALSARLGRQGVRIFGASDLLMD
jgi:2-amino-4-hydroxy-6-hydroxymethyldihydropteridine diphosphokinase